MRQLPKVRIIGGGLTGLLCAFEAHRLGAREIELCEAWDELGGAAWPRSTHGLELRETHLKFAGPGDPVRELLARNGLAFDEVENRCGGVSPAGGEDLAHHRDFPGPTLAARDLTMGEITGESLADRLRAYPEAIRGPLSRYCQWRLGSAWLDEVHESAARALGVHRVYPAGTDPAVLAGLKRADPIADNLYGLPAAMWGRLPSLTASLPKDGVRAFLTQARLALQRLGVTVRTGALIAPQAAMDTPDGITVWAADPMALFRPLGLDAPKARPHRAMSYIFKARYAGQAPLELRNFTAEGSVAVVRLYESRGQALLAAECVAEISDGDLRRELHRLTAGFCGGSLTLGETVSVRIEPRWDCPSMDAVRKLRGLRKTLAKTQGDGFVAPAWEAPRLKDRLADLSVKLAGALDVGVEAVAA
jgi:hypothetical protein